MAFASRIPGNLEPNALSRLGSERLARGLDLLDLTVSNPTRCGFAYPERQLKEALSGPGVLAYDPDPRGPIRVRAAVAAHHGEGLGADDLVLCSSTSEAYGWIFKLFGEPGDEVLVPSPSYPLFGWLARLEGLRAVPVPAFRFERWNLDLGGLERAAGPRTRAVVVVNPNNPTGHFLTRKEWGELCAFCARRGLVLVVDEVFADYPLEAPTGRLASALADPDPPCPVLVLSGLSKVALLPQVKLAWIAVRGPGRAGILEGLEFIADQYLPVSAAALEAAPALLALAPGLQAQALARMAGNLRNLDAALAHAPAWSRLPVEGGWSVVLRRPALEEDEAFAEAVLERRGVQVHPGSYFGFPGEGHLVLSLIVPEADFREGLVRLLGAS